MKTEKEIEMVLRKIDGAMPTKYQNMSYEQGVEEAMQWILEEIPDNEFEFTMRNP